MGFSAFDLPFRESDANSPSAYPTSPADAAPAAAEQAGGCVLGDLMAPKRTLHDG